MGLLLWFFLAQIHAALRKWHETEQNRGGRGYPIPRPAAKSQRRAGPRGRLFPVSSLCVKVGLRFRGQDERMKNPFPPLLLVSILLLAGARHNKQLEKLEYHGI